VLHTPKSNPDPTGLGLGIKMTSCSLKTEKVEKTKEIYNKFISLDIVTLIAVHRLE
jgi:hypothetical protein